MSSQSATITDANSGTTAKVLVGLGFNCYSFVVRDGEEQVETLWACGDFANGTSPPSHSGIPLLFPFPGRIRGDSFSFGGKTYSLPAGDGIGNAIHGFVLNRPWRLLEQKEDSITGEFQASVDDPEILNHWPADFRITVTYEVRDGKLASYIRVENRDENPLPFGMGTHPYFRLPLGSKGNAQECVITVPAQKVWKLQDMLPTGETAPASEVGTLSQGMRFADTKFDDVFSELDVISGKCHTSIVDEQAKRRLRMVFSEQFGACVIYNPPHREAICIEPYSCIPDPLSLSESGVESGLQILPPGGAWSAQINIYLEKCVEELP